MKKILIATALFFISLSASAQLSVGGGFLYDFWPTHVKTQKGNQKGETFEMSGLYAGASYNWEITGFGLGIAPGAYFSYAGGVASYPNGQKARVKGELVQNRMGSRHLALTLPVYATYSLSLGPGTFFAYGGPSLQCGISFKRYEKGRSRISTSSPWNKFTEESSNYFGKDYNIRPFDMKFGFGAGYRWNFIQVNLGIDLGCIDRDPDSGYSMHSHAMHFGAAYVF